VWSLADPIDTGYRSVWNPVGVNIGVKPRDSTVATMKVAESVSSLVGPVGIEPTTCGLKVRCSTKSCRYNCLFDKTNAEIPGESDVITEI